MALDNTTIIYRRVFTTITLKNDISNGEVDYQKLIELTIFLSFNFLTLLPRFYNTYYLNAFCF